MIHIRPMEPQEYDFLMDMHYESIHIEQGKPPRSELLNSPGMVKYNENWGRQGDTALIALIDNIPAGAAWYRLFDETNQGYGFVDAQTPELGVAVRSDYRQRGVGIRLMQAITQQAVSEGYTALSLSVDPENQAAVRLYDRLGFQFHGISGTSWTMKLDITN
ncbi:GNAT family N-acetyltransferase [Paenibacillus sp. FSL P4-0338]|uniref:GNAT family N-acetyltransferase n=1 Tax=unclassified Paenibacillus TaxID=185978 RepID=UPI0003E1D0CD|nr:GNAT family N-acetyltransferase [Paenibacillus sp. FSL R7-269]ETT32572.1 acetyltransferase [Paenibacillus sp. FSL R7-269]